MTLNERQGQTPDASSNPRPASSSYHTSSPWIKPAIPSRRPLGRLYPHHICTPRHPTPHHVSTPVAWAQNPEWAVADARFVVRLPQVIQESVADGVDVVARHEEQVRDIHTSLELGIKK